MPSSPYPITGTDQNEMLTQMQTLLDDLYQNRLGGANIGDVFQIGSDDVFQLRYLAIGGLQKISGALSVKADTTKGVNSGIDGIFIIVKADTGLVLDSNGLYVKIKADTGLVVDANGIYVKVKSGGGLAVDANGLAMAVTPLAGTKVYYVADASGGDTTRKLTFTDGILTAET